jgi:arginyl-tRNA synthetase
MIKKVISDKLHKIISGYMSDKGLTETISYAIEIPPKNIEADFALNAVMPIAKTLKMPPKNIADEIIEIILRDMSDIVEKAVFFGAFINLTVSNKFLLKELQEILNKKESYAIIPLNKNKKVLIEFVSANPTGPLHIGHGRGAAIGDSLAKIFAHLGYNVKREYYINDAGNQMFILGESLKIRYLQLKGENLTLPEDYYQGEYIQDIASRLIKENKNTEDIDFKEEAVSDILKGIKNDLKDFDVIFQDDEWFSENIIATKKDKNGKTEVDKACQYIQEKEFAYVKDGALWLKTSLLGDDKDRVLKRSDGRYTYFASDIAYHKNKFERGFDRLVDLMGADHHGYVPRMKAGVQMLGFDKSAVNIILYQLVSLMRNGQPLAMSTRTGEFVTLREVIDEVGKDACRFSFLLNAPDSQVEFDLELAKKQSNENPVFYVQYVNARCNSIFKESLNKKLPSKYDLNLLTSKDERNLIKQLCLFHNALSVCEKTMSPHHLVLYLVKLSDLYHRFYESVRVLTDDVNLSAARLKLLEAVTIIIKNGLSLIGASAPEYMSKRI